MTCMWCNKPIKVFEGDDRGRFIGYPIHEGNRFRCQVNLDGPPQFATFTPLDQIKVIADRINADSRAQNETLEILNDQINQFRPIL